MWPEHLTEDEGVIHQNLTRGGSLVAPAVPLLVVRLTLDNAFPRDAEERIQIQTFPVVAIQHQVMHAYTRTQHGEDTRRPLRRHEELLAAGYRYAGQTNFTAMLFLEENELKDQSSLCFTPCVDDELLRDDPLLFTVQLDCIIPAGELERVTAELSDAAEEAAEQERQNILSPSASTPS